MPLYIIVNEGPHADQTVPILAIADPHIIEVMLTAIRHLGQGSLRQHRGQEHSDVSETSTAQQGCTHCSTCVKNNAYRKAQQKTLSSTSRRIGKAESGVSHGKPQEACHNMKRQPQTKKLHANQLRS